MLASIEHITPDLPLTWRLTAIEAARFESVWHFHHEFELTWIRAGHGTRLVGDSVGDYAPGDLTLIGPDVPHTYVSTPGGGVASHAAVVVQFRRDFLGESLFDSPVFAGISEMLDRSSRGISFRPDDVDLCRLATLPPAEATVELLAVLLTLSQCDATLLASAHDTPALNRATAGRIEAMVERIHVDYASRLTLPDIAAAAHLTPSAASRLFSRSTGSTTTSYLNVVRVNVACRLLRDTDLPVSVIAGHCGFANLSNFNRRFRQVKKTTPREFRAGFVVDRR